MGGLASDFMLLAMRAEIGNIDTLRAAFKVAAVMLGAEPCDKCRKELFERLTTKSVSRDGSRSQSGSA